MDNTLGKPLWNSDHTSPGGYELLSSKKRVKSSSINFFSYWIDIRIDNVVLINAAGRKFWHQPKYNTLGGSNRLDASTLQNSIALPLHQRCPWFVRRFQSTCFRTSSAPTIKERLEISGQIKSFSRLFRKHLSDDLINPLNSGLVGYFLVHSDPGLKHEVFPDCQGSDEKVVLLDVGRHWGQSVGADWNPVGIHLARLNLSNNVAQ